MTPREFSYLVEAGARADDIAPLEDDQHRAATLDGVNHLSLIFDSDTHDLVDLAMRTQLQKRIASRCVVPVEYQPFAFTH
jgi:hypothetical protein